jgi:hypothetical protein
MVPIDLDIQTMEQEEKYTFVDTDGLKITLDTKIDLSDATNCIIKCSKPDESSENWAAQVDPDNNNYIYYVTQDGDLNQIGDYQLQAYVEFSDGSHFYGDIDILTVKKHI